MQHHIASIPTGLNEIQELLPELISNAKKVQSDIEENRLSQIEARNINLQIKSRACDFKFIFPHRMTEDNTYLRFFVLNLMRIEPQISAEDLLKKIDAAFKDEKGHVAPDKGEISAIIEDCKKQLSRP